MARGPGWALLFCVPCALSPASEAPHHCPGEAVPRPRCQTGGSRGDTAAGTWSEEAAGRRAGAPAACPEPRPLQEGLSAAFPSASRSAVGWMKHRTRKRRPRDSEIEPCMGAFGSGDCGGRGRAAVTPGSAMSGRRRHTRPPGCRSPGRLATEQRYLSQACFPFLSGLWAKAHVNF